MNFHIFTIISVITGSFCAQVGLLPVKKNSTIFFNDSIELNTFLVVHSGTKSR